MTNGSELAAAVDAEVGVKITPAKGAALWATLNAAADAVHLPVEDLRALLLDHAGLHKIAIRQAQRIRWLEHGHGEEAPPTDPAALAERMRGHVNSRLAISGEPALANGAWAMLLAAANTLDMLTEAAENAEADYLNDLGKERAHRIAAERTIARLEADCIELRRTLAPREADLAQRVIALQAENEDLSNLLGKLIVDP